MSKAYLRSILFFIIGLCALAVNLAKAELTQAEVCHKNKCFKVEVAEQPQDLMRGLQFRSELAEEAGMLFIFPMNAPHRFWMKDTLIPLDMIWINESNRIVYIAPKVQPCKADRCPSYGPPAEARYVLEINAGLSAKYGFKMGDPLDFHI